MKHIDKVAIWMISILPVLLFCCKNEHYKYPETVYGDWISVESEHSWIRFDTVDVVFNIQFNNSIIHDTSQYMYINTIGYGVIPITNESYPIGAIEFHIDEQNSEEIIVSGDNYDMEALFTYHMIPGKIPIPKEQKIL